MIHSLIALFLVPAALAEAPLPEEVLRSIDFKTSSKNEVCENKLEYQAATRHSGLYTVFIQNGTGNPLGFDIEDRWAVSAAPGRNPVRKWNFWFTAPGSAMMLTVQDKAVIVDKNGIATTKDSTSREKSFILFPRRQFPLIRYSKEKNELEVTLSTGEQVIFDSETKKLKSGVFSEVPNKSITVNDENGMKVYFPNSDVKYNGVGVWAEVESDKVVIHKNTRTCTVSRTDFFDTTSKTCVQFPFKVDAQISAYLKKKCGFALE